nr:MAG TPA: Tobravirus 2B protein [Caudoviricetes sp.]
MEHRQGINNVHVDGDSAVTKTYPVAFTKFQLPMCVNHTANYSGWAYCTNNGTLTSVKIYATHEWMNLAVVAIGV